MAASASPEVELTAALVAINSVNPGLAGRGTLSVLDQLAGYTAALRAIIRAWPTSS